MNIGQHILNALIVGIATGILGLLIFQLIPGQRNVKLGQTFLGLFALGIVLYLLIELTGIHKRFCVSYLK